jgi:YVTN family beta-propeller protein
MAFSPDGKRFVVTSLRRDQVDVYDASNFTLLKRFAMKDMPSHLAFSPDSRRVFVTLQGTRDIAAIDLERLEVVFRAQVGRQPAGIAWTPANYLLVGIMGRDHVAVVNPDDGSVVRTIPTGRGAHAVFPSPDGKQFYVTNRVSDTITVIDGTTLQVVRTLVAPNGADCVAFSPDGKLLWFTRRWAQKVDVIDLETGETVHSIPVGRSPHGLYVHADP